MKKHKTIIRSRYNDDYVDPGTNFHNAPSMTDASQAASCDINVILDHYLERGFELPDALKAKGVAQYGDFPDSCDYQSALNLVNLAHEQFNAMPSKLRNIVENDPERFLDYVHDEKNLEELHDLGLLSEEGARKVEAKRTAKYAPKTDKA